MIQKPIVPPPVIFIGCALIMAYLPNPYPFEINVLAVYLVVSVSSAIAFFSLWQFYKSKANINPIHLEKSNVFVVNGIYRFSRNPMYLSLAILLIAFALWRGNLWALSVLPLFISYIQIFQILPEERMLTEKFGRDYQDYCARVRRWV